MGNDKTMEDIAKEVLKKGTARDGNVPEFKERKKNIDIEEMSKIAQQVLRTGSSRVKK